MLLLAAGFGVLAIVVGIMLARRVETPEVLATVFFVGIFVAFMFWGIKGGVLAGVAATLAYLYVRYPAIEAVGFDRFAGLVASRSLSFLAFGALGGWANQQLEGSLEKLELYDQIDDDTGLYNARFFIQDSDLEMSRAQRYQTIFSVASVDIPAASIAGLGKRQRASTLKGMGRMIQDALRTVDRAAFGVSDGMLRLAVILPETGREGARIFIDRLVERVAAYLNQRGAHVDRAAVEATTVTLPEDKAGLDALTQTYREIDRIQHPDTPATSAGSRTPPTTPPTTPSAPTT